VRASATSKISSAASYAAAQAKPDANTAHEASPFALLVGSVASKDTKDAGRSPSKDAASDRNANDKSAKGQDGQGQDSQADVTQTAAPAKTSGSSKPEKSDKGAKDAAKAGSDSDPQVSAADPQTQDLQAALPPDPQNMPVPPPVAQPPVVQPVIPVAAEGEADDLAIDTAAPVKPQTDIKAPTAGDIKPGIKADTQTGAPAKSPAKPAAVADLPVTADSEGEEAIDTQAAEPVIPATPVAGADEAAAAKTATAPAQTPAPAPTKAPANIQTAKAAGDQSQSVQTGDVTNTDAAAQETAQTAPAKDSTPKDAAKNDVSPADNVGKNSGPKNIAAKSRVGQADSIDKADTAKSDAPANDLPKTAASQPDVQPAPNAKAAPQPAPAETFAVNATSAPQTLSAPAATATANVHVHVSAQPTPDLPSLAVTIAAKSQAGAKQFDIRLDPPELGRVEVRLSIDATGKASAHLSADQPQTLSLLQKDAPVLARALRDAGLDVSQDGLNFSLRQQGDNQNGNAGNSGRRGSSRSFPLNASISIDPVAGSAAYRGIANGRLDIRV